MSSTRQAVHRGESFTGFGYRPSFTPCHQPDFDMGMIGGIAGDALGLPTICESRTKPTSGRALLDMIVLLLNGH